LLKERAVQIDLADKVALVTGSAHRVGRAIALELAQVGVHVMVHYNSADADTLRDTVHELKAAGVRVHTVQANLAQPEGIDHTLSALREAFGRVDILVNNASVFPQGPLLDVTLESWDLTMNVNLRAPFLLTQGCARLMLAQDPPGGSIINILDVGVHKPWPKRPHHGVSKAALWALTQVSALALAPHIRVNGVVPGPVMKTNDGMTDETWAEKGQALPLQTTGEASDVGRAVVYLARESFITGTMIQVNGGEHLR
jgi:NAD(P)-dependent dehydrogenase (short-subunit alcohol dehydrogenase family)